MENPVKPLVSEMRKHLYGSELPLEPAFADRIVAHPKPEIIAAIFGMQSSVSQDLILKLPDFMKTLDYTDLAAAFELLQADGLAVYHYRDFLAQVFGIDVAEMSGNRIRSNSKPSDWSHEYLSGRNIDQDQLINRMQQQGAPMI